TEGGNSVLTLSDDFKAPDTPDPHWQVVDSSGNIYLLQKLSIKGGGMNRKITVPKYVPDIAKVQIWCAFAEVNLGEAVFEHPVKYLPPTSAANPTPPHEASLKARSVPP